MRAHPPANRLVGLLAAALIAGCASNPSPSPTTGTPSVPAATRTARPAPSLTPSPDPSPTAAPPPGVRIRWEPIGRATLNGNYADEEAPTAAAGFDRGYILVANVTGYPYALSMSIHFSPDGATWERVRLPHAGQGRAGARSAASSGRRVVVVGTYSPCRGFDIEAPPKRCRYRPVSWVSEDGVTWRESAAWTRTVAPDGGAMGSAFSDVWPVPSGGWDATQVEYRNVEDADGVFSALWHSDDGLTWRPLHARFHQPEGADPDDCAPPWRPGTLMLTDAAGRRIAIGWSCDYESVLWVSTDGGDLEQLREYSAAIASADRPFIVNGTAPGRAGPWVFVGETNGPSATAWSSPDLRTWTTSAMRASKGGVGSMAIAVASVDAGYVATGFEGSSWESDAPWMAVTWWSDDGVTWRIAGTGGPRIHILASGPAGLLGLVLGKHGIGVWRLVSSP